MMDRLDRAEAIGIRLDRNPRFRRSLLLVFDLDRRPDPEHLKRSLQRASAKWLPLRSVLRPYSCDILPPKWVPREDNGSEDLCTLPASGNPAKASDLQVFAPVLLQAFDPGEPLWNFWEAPGLNPEESTVVLKLHPLVAGNLHWLSLLLEPGREPEPDARVREIPDREEVWLHDLSTGALDEIGQHLERLRRRLANIPAMARTPRQSIEDFVENLQAAASVFGSGQRLGDTRPGQAPYLSSCHVSWIDLEEAARVTRSSPREIVMTALSAAIGAERSGPVACGLEDPDYPWVATRVALSSKFDEPRRRIRDLQHKIRPADAQNARTFLPEIGEILDRLPQPLLEAAADESFASSDFRCDLQAGLPTPAFLAGGRIRRLRSFQTTRGHRLAASMIRSLDDVSIGLTIDSRAFPQPDSLVDGFREHLQNLIRLAG